MRGQNVHHEGNLDAHLAQREAPLSIGDFLVIKPHPPQGFAGLVIAHSQGRSRYALSQVIDHPHLHVLAQGQDEVHGHYPSGPGGDHPLPRRMPRRGRMEHQSPLGIGNRDLEQAGLIHLVMGEGHAAESLLDHRNLSAQRHLVHVAQRAHDLHLGSHGGDGQAQKNNHAHEGKKRCVSHLLFSFLFFLGYQYWPQPAVPPPPVELPVPLQDHSVQDQSHSS